MRVRAWAIAGLCGATVCLASTTSSASCGELNPLADDMKEAAAIFLGRVVGMRLVISNVDGTFLEETELTLRVERAWKGRAAGEVRVRSCGTPQWFCTVGDEYVLGERYVMFAYGKPMHTSICTRTRRAGDAQELMRELDRAIGTR